MPNRRDKTPLAERLLPCQCCNYPLSQRHHLLEVSQYGENRARVQLCANCHEFYHIAYKMCVLKSKSKTVKRAFLAIHKHLEWNAQMTFILGLIEYVQELKDDIDIELLRSGVDASQRNSKEFSRCVHRIVFNHLEIGLRMIEEPEEQERNEKA